MNSDEIQTTVAQVTKALEALHNPSSNVQILKQSQEFLEEVKRRPNAYSYALVLLKQPNEIVRHFALHIIENLVKNQWVNASDTEKQSVKNEILGFISTVQLNEQKFIKEKMVTVVVEIVKRDWPQRWADLLDSLVRISSLGETQAEVVLLTLGQLPHEIIFDSSSNNMIALSDERKKDLMNGINHAITSLFSYFYSMLELRYKRYLENNTDKVNVHLVSTLLSTLLSYIEWVPIELILQHKLDFIFCQLLREIPFRLQATEALMLFLSRRGRPEERANFLNMFNMLDRVTDAMAVATPNHEVDYAFHKRVAQTLTVLGTNHLEQSAKDNLPPNYHNYLQLMIQMVNHPSILLTSLAIPFWSSLLKSLETLGQIQFQEPLLAELLNISLTKILKVGDPKRGDETAQSKYSAIDFGTTTEWSQFYSTVRNRFMDIIKQIAVIQPVLAFNFAVKKLRELISVLQSATAPITHEQTLLLESNSLFLELVILSLPPNFFDPSSTFQQSIQDSESLLKQLLEVNFTDPNATSFQMDCIKPFIPYYNSHPQSIQFLLSKIVPMIPFRSVGEKEGSRLSNNTLHCRRRIISCLSNLASSMPDKMLLFLPQLYSSIQQLFASNTINHTERVMLFYLLIVLNNHVSNFQQSSDFLREVITPIIQIWTSPEITAAIQSPGSLISFLGLDQNSMQPSEEIINRRKNLQYSVASLQTMWKKSLLPPVTNEESGFIPFISNGISYPSKWPISNYAKDIMPNVVALARTVHALWNPAVIAKIAPDYAPIFKLDEAITAPLLGHEYHKVNNTEPENIKFVRNLLDTLRDSCYEIIGYGFTHADELFSIATLPKILIDSIFSSLEFCENRHLKLIIRHVLIFMSKHCPTKLQSPFFDTLLPSLLTIIFNRIKSGWEAINIRSQKENKSDDSEQNEIIEDKILRDLTLEYILWVRDFASHPVILKNPEIVNPLVYGLTVCLMSNDHSAIGKSTPIIVQLVEMLSEDSRFYNLIGNDVLRITLNVLSQAKTQDFNNDLIAIVRVIYVKLAKRCPFPNQIMSTLPNIDQAALNKLENEISKSKNEKQQRNIMKKLLEEVVNINQSKGKKQSILDLPEKLFVNKMSTSTDDSNFFDSNNNTDHTINLFDQ